MTEPLNDVTTGTAGPPASTPSGEPSAPVKADAQPSQPGPGAQDQDGRGWVPSYRLRETTDRADRAEQQLRELQQRVEDGERRMKAAFGIDQPDPQREKIRQDFFEIVPEVQKLSVLAGRVKEIEEILESKGQVAELQSNYWTNAGHRQFDVLDKEMSSAYGNKVPPFAKQTAYAAFIHWVTNDPEAGARYQRSDAALATDFWKQYSSGVLEPARQHFTAQEQARRDRAQRVPRGGGGGDIVPGKREKKVYKDIDEAIDAGYDMLKEQSS